MALTGHHLAAEMSECQNLALLNQTHILESVISEAILGAGLGLISIHSHLFAPHGITCIAIISESHVAVHTYPEHAHMSVDVFTCAPQPQAVESILQFIQDQVKPVKTSVVHLLRSTDIRMLSENTDTKGY